MPDEMEGRGLAVVGDIQHGVPHRLALGGALGAVHRLGEAQTRTVDILRRPQTVKLQPDVFPGVGLAGAVGVDLPGAD